MSCRNVNTREWIAVLPRISCQDKSRERYISRLLSNKLIDPTDTIGGYIPELMEMQQDNGMTIILMLDQSKIAGDFECLMIGMRVGERAIPVAWKVIKTKGEIGFTIQKELPDKVVKFVPKDALILLAADRFHGTSALVDWCKKHKWQYRIRLKGNLIFNHEGGEITALGSAQKVKLPPW